MLIALLSALYLYNFGAISEECPPNDWGYNRGNITVGEWAETCPECNGTQQSPIDVTFANDSSTFCNESLILEWTGTSEPLTFVIQNTGRSLKALPFQIEANGGGDLTSLEVLHHTNETDIRLQNQFYNTYTSPVNKEYCFDSLHFHWGRNNSEGSEHTYNGKAYPLEVHFVHYSCDYYLLGPAVADYQSGKLKQEPYDDDHVLAVIGVVFEIGDPNPVLEAMFNATILEGIRKYTDPTTFGNHLLELYYTELNITGLLPRNKEFLAYRGSLTTPPCLQTVRWHNMKTPMTVSEAQMEKFRSLASSLDLNDTQAPNYRPPQPLYDRTIYQCKEAVEAEYVEKGWPTAPPTMPTMTTAPTPTEAVVTGDSATSSSSCEESDTWFIIGVVFICLFGVTLIVLVFVYYVAYIKESGQAGDDGNHKYKKTELATNK